MSIGNPWWLLLLGLALLVVVLHARRRRELPVSSILLWRHLASHGSSRPQRRFPPITPPLLLQLLALILLISALAQPYLRTTDSSPDHLVVVIDASASMHASDVSPSRLGAARAAGHDRLAALPTSARGTVIEAGANPVATSARLGAGNAAAQLERSAVSSGPIAGERAGGAGEGGAGPADWHAAARLAAGTIRPGERTLVLLLSDPSGVDAAGQALQAEIPDVEIVTREFAGSRVRNVGFADVRPEPLDLDGGHWSVTGEVVSAGAAGETTEMRVLFEPEGSEGALAWDTLELEPVDGEALEFELELELPGPGSLELRLPDDDLNVDNRARFILREGRVSARVLHVGPENPELQRALQAIDAVELFRAESLPADNAEYDLVIVDRTEVDRRPDTNVLWIAASRHRARPNAMLSEPDPSGWRSDHPLAASMDWSSLTVSAARDVGLLQGATVLLEARGAPLIQVRTVDEHTEVVLSFALRDSNWPSQLGFPLFVSNLVRTAQPALGRAVLSLDAFHPRESILAGGTGTREAAAASGPLDWPLWRWPVWRWLVLATFVVVVLEALIAGLASERYLRRQALGAGNPLAGRHRTTVALQAGAAALLLLALLSVSVPFPGRQAQTVLIVEDERFLTGEATEGREETGRSSLDFLDDDAATGAGIVRLGAPSTIVRDAGKRGRPTSAPAGVAGADLESAIDLAAGMLASGMLAAGTTASETQATGTQAAGARGGAEQGRIVIVGGALSTVGEASRSVPGLVASGITVDVLPPGGIPAGESLVEEVVAPERLHPSQTFRLEGIVFSESAQQASVTLYRDGEVLVEREVHLEAGRNRVETEADEEEAGTYLYEVEVDSQGDVFSENNRAGQMVRVLAPPSVLLVSPQAEWAELFADALLIQGVEAEINEPLAAPWNIEGWLEHDVVVLMNVPALDLHSTQQELLATWVTEHGGGLLILGGENSFGPGGYYQTPLEDLSPLSSQVPREAPAVAMLFVLDRSGSMQQQVGESTRLQIAKEATIEAIDLLGEESLTGVVVFDSESTVLAPIQPVENRDAIAAELELLGPSGGTAIQPALEQALEQMRGVDASTRHVVLMTDGLSQQGQFTAVMEGFEAAETTVSSVAIGSGADTALLQQIARAGGGTFHSTTDFRALPSILAQEALLLSGTPIEETSFQPQWADRGVEFLAALPEDLPPLHGYVLTTPKGGADVHLLAPDDDPVLASWRHGLGRVVAFTSHGAGSWSRDWLSMTEFPLLWAQAVRWTLPQVAGPGLTPRVSWRGDEAQLLVDAIDAQGRPLSELAVEAEIEALEDSQGDRRLVLQETDRGRYEGTVELTSEATYRLTARTVSDPFQTAEELEPAVLLFRASYPARYAFSRQDASELLAISESTGGQVLFSTEDLPATSWRWRWQPLEAWPFWLLLALTLFMLSLFSRYAPRFRRKPLGKRSAGSRRSAAEAG
ncbi:MAG: VWA domain-containing protein [Trueperaceae bacterium]